MKTTKKPNSKSAPQAAEENTAPLTEPESLARSRQNILNAVPDIVNALINEAKAGHYLHARLLFDFASLTAAPQAQSLEQTSPLIALMIKELGLEDKYSVPSTQYSVHSESQRIPRQLSTDY